MKKPNARKVYRDIVKIREGKGFHKDNRAVSQVDMKLTQVTDAISPMSINSDVLSSEAEYFIDTLSERALIDTSLKLNIVCCKKSNKKQQELVSKCIKTHYFARLHSVYKALKLNKIKCLGMTIVGAVLLSTSYLLFSFGSITLINDFVNIAGTFCLWEAVDFYFLERNALKLDYVRKYNIYNIDIIYSTIDKEKETSQ